MSNMDKVYPLLIDLSEQVYPVQEHILFNQLDTNTAYIDIHIKNNHEVIDLSDMNILMNATRNDGENIQTLVEKTYPKEGICRVNLSRPMLEQAGLLRFQISLYKEDKITVTQTFFVNIDRAIEGDVDIESDKDYTILTQLIKDVGATTKKNEEQIRTVIKLKSDWEELEKRFNSDESQRVKDHVKRTEEQDSKIKILNEEINAIPEKSLAKITELTNAKFEEVSQTNAKEIKSKIEYMENSLNESEALRKKNEELRVKAESSRASDHLSRTQNQDQKLKELNAEIEAIPTKSLEKITQLTNEKFTQLSEKNSLDVKEKTEILQSVIDSYKELKDKEISSALVSSKEDISMYQETKNSELEQYKETKNKEIDSVLGDKKQELDKSFLDFSAREISKVDNRLAKIPPDEELKGDSIVFLGVVETQNDLPINANPNDSYYVKNRPDNGLYIMNKYKEWIFINKLDSTTNGEYVKKEYMDAEISRLEKDLKSHSGFIKGEKVIIDKQWLLVAIEMEATDKLNSEKSNWKENLNLITSKYLNSIESLSGAKYDTPTNLLLSNEMYLYIDNKELANIHKYIRMHLGLEVI